MDDKRHTKYDLRSVSRQICRRFQALFPEEEMG